MLPNLILTLITILVIVQALRLMLKLARNDFTAKIAQMAPDPFRSFENGQNWNWDYVMVFKVYGEDQEDKLSGKKNEFRAKNTLKKVLNNLSKGGLESKCFFSRDRDRVFVKIRASYERLAEQADDDDYIMRLDESEVQKRMAEGGLEEDGSYEWLPRAYSDEIIQLMDDDAWCEANYKRGRTNNDRVDVVTLRHKGKEHANKAEEEKPKIGKIEPIVDVMQQNMKYAWYQYIYGKFDTEKPELYAKNFRTNSPFRGVDRLILIMIIMENRLMEGGCGLNTSKMEQEGCIEAIFPLHDEEELNLMAKKFFSFWTMPWNLPLDDVKDYFGEKIGLYFTFLCHYTSWLMVPAFAGGLVYFHKYYARSRGGFLTMAPVDIEEPIKDVLSIPVFCVIMAFWSTAYLESWKNRQIETSMKWGTNGFEDTEEDRPEFEASEENIEINSPVTGEPEFYFPPDIARRRSFFSYFIISLCILFVLVSVFAVFAFKAMATDPRCTGVYEDLEDDKYAADKYQCEGATTKFLSETFKIPTSWLKPIIGALGGDTETVKPVYLGAGIAGAVNSVMIIVNTMWYTNVARKLNDAENHRTDTIYEDNLIMKSFLFQFVNTYFALIFIAFIKEPIMVTMFPVSLGGGIAHQCKGTCMDELGMQLFSNLVIKALTSNAKEAFVPYLVQTAKKKAGEKTRSEAEYENTYKNPADLDGMNKRMRSAVEYQFCMTPFEVILDAFEDYKEMALQFGYAVLFVAAFPLAPLMAFANNYTEIRIDMWKYGAVRRRAEPRKAEDIGSWESILTLMATLAVVTNSALVCFTGTFLDGYPTATRWLIFVCMEHGIIILKEVLALILPDVPDEVQMQLDRSEFISGKLLDDDKDEIDISDDEDEDTAMDLPDAIINSTDDDVILIEHVIERERAEEERKLRMMKETELVGGEGSEESKML